MSEKKLPNVNIRIIKSDDTPINKASSQTHLENTGTSTVWISPPADLKGLKALTEHSSILPQCIRAYKNNIAGFGIGVKYKENYSEETAEMKAEYERAVEIIQLLNMDSDTKEVFENIIESREIYGISYLEVIRNLVGEVCAIEFIKDTPSIQKTVPMEPNIDIIHFYNGKEIKRSKKFCKYKQQLNGKTVYFKEIGDIRIMDKDSGEYSDNIPLERQANEILEFSIGIMPYGEVRWLGQVLGVDGSRMAEALNNRYFKEGRHTPLMILVNGGTLSDDSFSKLQEYMNGIKGENGQHSFMVLETEDLNNRTGFDDKKPTVEIKDLASILQKDELFQEYLDNNRRRIQSSFLLSDLYVGYTTDFNRATSQSSKILTEEQVFQPERRSLAWIINNKLLNDYHFKYVEAYFLAPDISNPDDLAKILAVTERAGGLPPNKAKEITYQFLGEVSEDYEGDWGNIPLSANRNQYGTSNTAAPLSEQLQTQIQKAAEEDNDSVVAVMKEVKALLKELGE